MINMMGNRCVVTPAIAAYVPVNLKNMAAQSSELLGLVELVQLIMFDQILYPSFKILVIHKLSTVLSCYLFFFVVFVFTLNSSLCHLLGSCSSCTPMRNATACQDRQSIYLSVSILLSRSLMSAASMIACASVTCFNNFACLDSWS